MQAITTLCRFQCRVAEVCALASVALVGCQVLCAEVVGAISSEGFLVGTNFDFQ